MYEAMCYGVYSGELHGVPAWSPCEQPLDKFDYHAEQVAAPLSLARLDLSLAMERGKSSKHAASSHLQFEPHVWNVVTPRMGQFVGTSNLLLNIGVQRRVVAVCKLNANASGAHECVPQATPPPGTMLGTLLDRHHKLHSFCGLQDYSSLANASMWAAERWARVDLISLVTPYAKLLSMGGILFLKWAWPPVGGNLSEVFRTVLHNWRHTRSVLSAQHFHPLHERLELSAQCPHDAVLVRELRNSGALRREQVNLRWRLDACGLTYSTWELSNLRSGKIAEGH